MYNPVMYESANVSDIALAAAEAESGGNYILDLHAALNATMPEPMPYGRFHLICFGMVILLTVLLSYFLRRANGKLMRAVLAFFWLAMVATELLEQFALSNVLKDGLLVFDYRWGTFPFQLCATGLWVLPFIILMPDGKLRDAMMLYMGLYSFFGGLLVYVVPTTVFTENVVTNVHTMVQHGSQIVVGVMLLVYNRRKLNIKNFLRATCVFLVLVAAAVIMNEVFYHVLLAYGSDSEFNMFYISPYYNSEMPVLGVVFDLVPWEIYITLYVVGFIMISFIIYFVAILSIHVAESLHIRREARRSPPTEGAAAVAAD